MKYLIFLPLLLCSCNFIPAIAPDDFVYIHPQPIQQDTCTEYIEVTTPAFVGGYLPYKNMEYTGGYIVVGEDTTQVPLSEYTQLADKLQGALEAWKPQFKYQVFHDTTTLLLRLAIVAEGTNDVQEFWKYVRISIPPFYYATGFGWTTQGLGFLRAVDADQFMKLAEEYPSAYWISLRETQYDSIDYIKICDIILSDCKAGRYVIDLQTIPYVIPDSIIDLFIDRGWEYVLH